MTSNLGRMEYFCFFLVKKEEVYIHIFSLSVTIS
jgi:hypothetical protein